MTYEQCECEVRQRLSEKRFYHSQCVAEEAVRLAVLYGADPEKARLAGLLHDILKDTPAEEQLKILQGFGIMMNDTELALSLIHICSTPTNSCGGQNCWRIWS